MLDTSRPVIVAPSLHIDYPATPQTGVRTLALLCHGLAPPAELATTLLAPSVALPVLAGAPYEHWQSARSQQRGVSDGIAYSEDGDWLMASIALNEDAAGGIEKAAAGIYRRLPAWLAARGYPHTVKIWHYLSEINRGDGDSERYRRFCIGRAEGMGGYPWLAAATAIGMPAQAQGLAPLTLYWLASRHEVCCIENPRQTPAFQYPREFGPVSPKFARAAWVGAASQLFVSGTAAIVGHQSAHAGSAVAQLGELVENLQAVVRQAECNAGLTPYSLQAEALKIYVRHREDLPALQAAAADRLPQVPTVWLQGDVCRADLLVEAEGIWGLGCV